MRQLVDPMVENLVFEKNIRRVEPGVLVLLNSSNYLDLWICDSFVSLLGSYF